jgi:hypothetical protein
MNTTLSAVVAAEHIADLRRAAEHLRAPTDAPASRSDEQVITLRVAQPEDDYDVSRLAQLDDAPLPVGRVMLAVVDGEAVAALSLSDGRVVADPFVATEKAVTLLRLRATQLSGQRHRRWRPRILRPRLA